MSPDQPHIASNRKQPESIAPRSDPANFPPPPPLLRNSSQQGRDPALSHPADFNVHASPQKHNETPPAADIYKAGFHPGSEGHTAAYTRMLQKIAQSPIVQSPTPSDSTKVAESKWPTLNPTMFDRSSVKSMGKPPAGIVPPLPTLRPLLPQPFSSAPSQVPKNSNIRQSKTSGRHPLGKISIPSSVRQAEIKQTSGAPTPDFWPDPARFFMSDPWPEATPVAIKKRRTRAPQPQAQQATKGNDTSAHQPQASPGFNFFSSAPRPQAAPVTKRHKTSAPQPQAIPVSKKHNIDATLVEDVEEEESYEVFRRELMKWFKQMMFVSGETTEPGPETTWMIEEIVREQVVEMLKEASALANRRGSKSISIVDLIFQIRHNPAKVSRLKTFLSWKDVRKNVKDSDDKAGGADADALDLEDGGPMGANPAAPQKTQANKKAKLILPWEVQSYFSEQVPEREDEEDEEEEEQNEATLARLASADERTKNMTKDEYVYWSDCRQASFTFRKGKRFREWAGFGTIIDSKPNDDVVDILGFLTFEIVQTLTEEALRVKNAEDLANKKAGRGDIEASKKRKREGCTLFDMPEEGRTPVEPRHVQEAFRRLQIVPNKYKFMRPGRAGIRTPLRMI